MERIVEAYGEREEFLSVFNPDLQYRLCADAERCFFGGYPTMLQINQAYGPNTAAMWMVAMLRDLSEYAGCGEKLEGKRLEMCASVIAAEFQYLSVAEMMLFFFRLKAGRYGRFYGSVDPVMITGMLRGFVRERSAAIEARLAEIERQKTSVMKKNAVPMPEYVRKHLWQ